MTENHTALASSIAAVVGDNNLTENTSLQINSLVPAFIAKPGSHTEVRECLKICSELNAAIVPAGAMTWLEGGNPLRRADVVLSMQRMNRVIDYSPPDLTATVEAGLSLDAFNEIARPENQWLPLDPPGAAASTLGAIAACASYGALRFGFGTPRDYVIGLRLAHIDGTESKCGGRVVKNVAGYDMNKLYVGSFGTLAVITELTFKLRPLPETISTLLIGANHPSTLIESLKRICASVELQPVSIILTNSFAANGKESEGLIRFADSEVAVQHQMNEAVKLLDKDIHHTVTSLELRGSKAWFQVASRIEDEVWKYIVKLNLPVANVATVSQKIFNLFDNYYFSTLDFGVGTMKIAFTADEQQAMNLIKQLRQEASAVGGNLFIERASPEIKNQLGTWDEVGDLAKLMRGLKRNFDPEGLLNPGRFVAGI